MREGLNVLDLYNLLKSNSNKFRKFVGSDKPITALMLIEKIDFKSSAVPNDLCKVVLEWFQEFVSNCNDDHAKKLLKFCTGLDKIPTLYELKINVEFMSEREGCYPKESACTSFIRFPVIHETSE